MNIKASDGPWLLPWFCATVATSRFVVSVLTPTSYAQRPCKGPLPGKKEVREGLSIGTRKVTKDEAYRFPKHRRRCGACELQLYNTKILTLRLQGNAIAWSSVGTIGFKGSRKIEPYAGSMAAEAVGKKAQDHGVKTLEVEVQAPSGPWKAPCVAPACCPVFKHQTSSRDVTNGTQRLPPSETPPRLKSLSYKRGRRFRARLLLLC